MNEQLFDHELRDVFARGPRSVPSGTVDRALLVARGVEQRRPRFARLDTRAWPSRTGSLADPSLHRTAQLVAVSVAILLLAAAIVVVGSQLLATSPPVVTIESSALDASILAPRAGVLPDGRVIVLGQDDTALTLFDPMTRQTTRLPIGGEFTGTISASPLPDGRIVLLGTGAALDLQPPPTLVALMDPGTGTVDMRGELPGTELSSAALLVLRDGRVVMSGGMVFPMTDLPCGTFTCEGVPTPAPTSEHAAGEQGLVFVFDPASGSSVALGPLLQPRFRHSMIELDDGRLLVVGGQNGTAPGGDVLELEVYDLAAGRSTLVGTIGPGRGLTAGPPVRLSDGRILVPGGVIPDPVCGSLYFAGQMTYLFDAASGRLDPGPVLPGWVENAIPLADGRALTFGYRRFGPVTSGPCIEDQRPLEPWLGVIDVERDTVYQSRDPRTGGGDLDLVVDQLYATGGLLSDGRVALIVGSDSSPRGENRIDLVTVFR